MNELILPIALAISVLLNAGLGFVVYRLSKRLLDFDELFGLLDHDVRTNVEYFGKLLQTPLLNGSDEIKSMQNNIKIIAQRLEEFSLRMSETTNKETPPAP